MVLRGILVWCGIQKGEERKREKLSAFVMEWNLKADCWDLSEVDEANIANMERVEGSNRYKGEFCVDLKLGEVGNSGTSKGGLSVGVSKMRSKRARGLNNGTQTVSCLVDGCHFDLSNCRDYHRRHKVCEVHSKTAQVTIGGHRQRFCQQCSRFHSLEEFDEGKRSCRKRLDGHNRRRRKPQPEPLTRSPTFFSNYQSTHLLPFSTSTTWATAEADLSLHGHHQVHDLFLGSSPTAYKEAYQSPHLPGPDASVGQAHMFLRTSPYSESDGLRCKLTSSVHDNTSGALSLLSSPQPHNPGPLIQPLGLSLHENTMGSVDPVLVPNDHSPSMYDLASNGSHSQGNVASPLFPFQWE